tara:strand:+ start:24 stop:335 length:312 start_codon:yes stop_codon:yes gene_type:complete
MDALKIIRPILSEKATLLSEKSNKYVFQVDKSVNKLIIKQIIEKRFDVKIKKVAVMNYKGKVKNMSMRSNGKVLRTTGNQASWKKAIVTLAEGHKIDLLNIEG